MIVSGTQITRRQVLNMSGRNRAHHRRIHLSGRIFDYTRFDTTHYRLLKMARQTGDLATLLAGYVTPNHVAKVASDHRRKRPGRGRKRR